MITESIGTIFVTGSQANPRKRTEISANAFEGCTDVNRSPVDLSPVDPSLVKIHKRKKKNADGRDFEAQSLLVEIAGEVWDMVS